MSMTGVLMERTGPAVADESLKPFVAANEADRPLPAQEIDANSEFRMTSAASTPERWLLLGSLLAQLRFVPFDDVEVLLDVHDFELVKMLHGERPITRKYSDRWERIQELVRDLSTVLRPEATGKWLHVAVPDLNGRAPIEAIRHGQLRQVLNVTRSYLDPSYK